MGMRYKRKEIDTTTFRGRFAEHLRTLRLKADLSIPALAERSGIPQATLEGWEGARKSPRIDRFPNLAKSLGVSVRKLLPRE